jgi:type II secretory pathway pseudopilin PulG
LIRHVLIVLLACLVATTASAQDRNAKIRALMEAQGLLDTMQQQMTAGRERARTMGKQMMDNVMRDLIPDEATKAKLSQASTEFIDASRSPMTAADFVAMWSQAYGSKFSDAELDGLLAYYRSPLAQKEVQVTREALTQVSERVQAQYRPILDAAVAHYVERLKAIVTDCHCAKQ